MSEQNYNNHIRWYVPHHFIFYPVVAGSTALSIYFMSKFPEQRLEWLAITGIFMLLAWLSYMTRQHYGLVNQNRIVRMELRLRYFILTQKRFETIEAQLSFGQLAALRFASDEEFPGLVERAVKEKLSSNEIKKAVKNWLPDTMRL